MAFGKGERNAFKTSQHLSLLRQHGSKSTDIEVTNIPGCLQSRSAGGDALEYHYPRRVARGFRNPTNYQSRILLRSVALTVA